MRRKILKAALVMTVIAGCVGCGDATVSQTPEVYQPTIDFLWDDNETLAPVGDVTRLEGYSRSDIEAETETESETEGDAANVADAGENATVKQSVTQNKAQNTTQNKEQNTVQSATQSVEQNEVPTEEVVTMDPEWESAWKEYLEALEEAEKYAMKYEVSEAGIENLKTFQKTELVDSGKEMYPNARAWKNKACNIAIVDNTKDGVTFTVDVTLGTSRSGKPAYIMTFKFSNGMQEDVEFVGSGTCLISLGDSGKFCMVNGTAKNLDQHVK